MRHKRAGTIHVGLSQPAVSLKTRRCRLEALEQLRKQIRFPRCCRSALARPCRLCVFRQSIGLFGAVCQWRYHSLRSASRLSFGRRTNRNKGSDNRRACLESESHRRQISAPSIRCGSGLEPHELATVFRAVSNRHPPAGTVLSEAGNPYRVSVCSPAWRSLCRTTTFML